MAARKEFIEIKEAVDAGKSVKWASTHTEMHWNGPPRFCCDRCGDQAGQVAAVGVRGRGASYGKFYLHVGKCPEETPMVLILTRE